MSNILTEHSCRICLTNNGSVSIFEKLVDNEQISEILMACTNLKIIPNDGFLDTICYRCIGNLNITYNFKKECLESDYKMRKYFIEAMNIENDIKSEYIEDEEIIYDDIEILDETTDDENMKVESEKLNIEKDMKSNILNNTVYNCSVCSKNFTRVENLVAHQKQSEENNINCNVCSKKFCNTNKLNDHIVENLHYSNNEHKKNLSDITESKTENLKIMKGYQCEICLTYYARKEGLLNHQSRTEETQVNCQICFKTLCNEKKLIEHLRGEHQQKTEDILTIRKEENIEILDERQLNNIQKTDDVSKNDLLNILENESEVNEENESSDEIISSSEIQKSLRCEYCLSSFSDEKSLTSHVRSHLQRNHKCNICNKMFLEDSHLNRHLSLMHNLKCLKCGIIFNNKNDWDLHSDTHSDNLLECDICFKSFKLQKSIQAHYQLLHMTHPQNVVKFICEICGMGYDSNRKLVFHNNVVHLGIKPYKCKICPQAYAYKELLREHINRHLNVKPFKCKLCEKSFHKQSNLSDHTKWHTGNMKYKCTFCSKKYLTPGHLKVHLRTHTGEKPYECKDCGKSYNYLNDYNIHMRIHTGEKPFKCKICDKGFRDSKTRSRHELVHTDEKPFECKLCDYKCKHPSNLRSHMKVHLKEQN